MLTNNDKNILLQGVTKDMKNNITKSFIMRTETEYLNIEDTKTSMVCIYNGGACIITSYGEEGEQGVDSPYFDIPEGVGFYNQYSECKKFLSDVGYSPINEFESQKLVNVYENGKILIPATVILEYYKADIPENGWKIYDNDGNLI